ncbi:MAG: DUF3800 domain-containing protein [Sulfitobacter sp.]
MAFFFFDDSKHHDWGFSLGAFVICENDPEQELFRIFENSGFDPKSFEFKSSSPMKNDTKLQALRYELRSFIQWNCKVAICVADGDKNLGPSGLKLLKRVLLHPTLRDQTHRVFFDEGLFSSSRAAMKSSTPIGGHDGCEFCFEQDSKSVLGIQLADLVAHTCGTMLLDALGKKMKLVKVEDSGYDDDIEIDLGFELWAGLRYAFLSAQKINPKDKFEHACVDVSAHGLFIDESSRPEVIIAANNRFSEMYLGCIH